MHFRHHFVVLTIIALMLGYGSWAVAQDATETSNTQGQSTTSTSGAVLHGHIADSTGALIPKTKILVINAFGKTVARTTSDTSGSYEVQHLSAGSYTIQAVFEGFSPFTSPSIQLVANQTKRLDISLAVMAKNENVTVSDESNGVSADANSSVGALVLKGSDLDALSDDPDEMENELNALAGPSAGPNGGQIYIDGFTGGTLPPKSSILEIRINQSPFSASYDRAGFGRIEIITKPGTDQFHGRGFVQGNDKSFNTGNPFTKTIPDYHTIMMSGNVSGSYKKKLSYFVSADGNDNQDASIYSAAVPALNSTTGLYYIPYDSNGNIITQTGSLFAPSKRWGFSPRFDFSIGQKNVVSLRVMYSHSTSKGSIGSTSLPSQANNSTSSGFTIQGSDAMMLSPHLASDLRIQYRRSNSTSSPVSSAPMISVADYFSGGGSSSQSSNSHSDHIELQDEFTYSAGRHAIKFGTWLRDNRQAQYSNSNFNGTFTFTSLQDYVDTLNGTPSAKKLTYTTGKTSFKANVFDAALYFQDDWKVSRFLTLSGGLRFESQNHIKDHIDFGPRIALAYALDGHKSNKSKTVARIGYGFFYDRFEVGSLMSLARNGDHVDSQTQTVITNPTCFNADSLDNIDLSTCGTKTNTEKTVTQLAPEYHSPYMEQFSASLERQLSAKANLSVSYTRTYGVHQTVTRNANAYLPGTYSYGSTTLTGTRPNPAKGIIKETDPEGIFKENQLTVMMNLRQWSRFTVTGFYSMSYSNGNTGTASNSYNLKESYGRSSFAHHNTVMLMGNIAGPFGISLNPMMNASSGGYYSITTSTDLTGDNFYNNRPAYTTEANCSAGNSRYVQTTSFGCLDVVPDSSASLLPVGIAKGPASITVNMRASRSFAVGPKIKQNSMDMNGMMGGGMMGGGPPMGGGGGGGRGGPGGGPGGGGGGGMMGGGPPPGGGGPMGMMDSGRRKYSLNFNVQAQNLFNNVNYGTPSGTVVPTLDTATGIYGPGSRFGKSTSLAGGMMGGGGGGGSSAVRRITLQMSFSF